MAFRLRRALSLSYPLLHRSVHQPKPISAHLSSPISTTNPAAAVIPTQLTRPFTSTSTLFVKIFDPDTDEIGPDTILFEGCDYNHWLITVDFPKDSNITRDQMIQTYVDTAAQVFGSVEEAKKKIYALSTTTYQGFQVECSEQTSEKFKSLPGVVFVLPDSYIDPANKEYGGDKYVNGEIFPRPPPVQYGRRDTRDRRRRDSYGPPQNDDFHAPARRQNFASPPAQQNYRPPAQQNYGPPAQQNYGPPPQQNYGPPPQQNYGPPPQQNYGPPPQQNYGNHPNSSHQQNYVPQGSGDRRGFQSPSNGNHYSEGQRDFNPGNSQGPNSAYGPTRGVVSEQAPDAWRNFSSTGNNN